MTAMIRWPQMQPRSTKCGARPLKSNTGSGSADKSYMPEAIIHVMMNRHGLTINPASAYR